MILFPVRRLKPTGELNLGSDPQLSRSQGPAVNHPAEPDNALSDGSTMVPLDRMRPLLEMALAAQPAYPKRSL